MFTGIVEAVGTVLEQYGDALVIRAPFSKALKPGQSVAVNGVCLTVVDRNRQNFQVQVLEETKKLTNLGKLKPGNLVNLERAMKASGRLDGHIMQGHVEGIGVIKKIVRKNGDTNLRIACESTHRRLLKYMIHKGIIVLDGIALTITKLNAKKSEIEVAITAYTWDNTNLKSRKIGDLLNIETDIFAKYAEKLFHCHRSV